jgi:holliday junction DNA helicase RuvA
MIGFLEGTVLSSENGKSIIQTTSGVGYEVATATALLPNKTVSLFISHIFRESGQSLFAFEDLEDKKLFELLIEVNGIGPKTAFNMISFLGSETVRRSIMMEDSNKLKETPGLGKKGAEQVILSLKDKITKFTVSQPIEKKTSIQTSTTHHHFFTEALTACQGLGYKDQQVVPLLHKLLKENEFKSTEELLTNLLREVR